MRVRQGIFIDYSNKAQVEWFVKVGRWAALMLHKHDLIETKTGKIIGAYYVPLGPFAKAVVKKNNSFFGETAVRVMIDSKRNMKRV